MELDVNDNLSWQVYADWLEDRGDPQADLYRRRYVINSIGMDLVLIPSGEFLMGSPPTEKGRFDDEGPQHEVEVTKPFYLGVYQVTQEQWKRVMGNNPSWFSSTGPGHEVVQGLDTSDFSVECVSWEDAVAFCKKLSEMPEEKQAGRVYRLPTEAEWEYACRAGTTTPFHFGESLSSEQANFNGGYPYGGASKGPFLGRTTDVGSYPPNVFGLYDMHGNVWEWCQDAYKPYKEGKKRSDPIGISSEVAGGTTTVETVGPSTASGAGRSSGTTTAGSVLPVKGEKGSEDEHSSDPIAVSSEAVAGSTTADTAGPPPATGSGASGITTSGSASSVEDEQGADPTMCSEAVAANSSAGIAVRPAASGLNWTSDTDTMESVLSATEDEHSSDPTPVSSTEVAGAASAGSAGRPTAAGTGRTTGTSSAGSVLPATEDEHSSDPTGMSSAAVAGSATAGYADPLSATGMGRTTFTRSAGSASPAIEGSDNLKYVIRGGCWSFYGRDCRSADRSWYRPDGRNDYIGFRLAAVQCRL